MASTATGPQGGPSRSVRRGRMAAESRMRPSLSPSGYAMYRRYRAVLPWAVLHGAAPERPIGAKPAEALLAWAGPGRGTITTGNDHEDRNVSKGAPWAIGGGYAPQGVQARAVKTAGGREPSVVAECFSIVT